MTAPDGIRVEAPSFHEADWRRIADLQRQIAEADGKLDVARARIMEHGVSLSGVLHIHRKIRGGTAGETEREALLAALDGLRDATSVLSRDLGWDNSLRNRYTELCVEHRQLQMKLLVTEAARDATVQYLTRELERARQSVPGLEGIITRERAANATAQVEATRWREAYEELVDTHLRTKPEDQRS